MDSLLGVRWTLDDINLRLSGIRKEKLLEFLQQHRKELEESGAVLNWPTPAKKAYKFRATAMAPWLEEHLDEIP